MSRSGLLRVAPKYLGDREDLTTVGGKKSRDRLSWADTNKELHDFEKRRVIAAVLEVAVSVVMCTHVYEFAGHYYLQKSGGPIGLRSMACLAALVMKLWEALLNSSEIMALNGYCIFNM